MSWMQTYGGQQFWVFNPREEQVDPRDIAHALSNICRFNGHCDEFYSVAQHSLHVSRMLEADGHDADVQLWGLLHDAAEAYIGDMIRPIKHSQHMIAYCAMEQRIMAVITARFGLPSERPGVVGVADNKALATEARDLLKPPPAPWGTLPEPDVEVIKPLAPGAARALFAERLAQIEQMRRRVTA